MKVCKKCNNPVFSKGLCQNHWRQQYSKPIKKKVPLKKTNKKIKPFSDRQKQRLKIYNKLRAEHLTLHPVCEVCNSERSTEIHHKYGRVGNNLFIGFLSVCRSCHQQIEHNPIWAKENGYSITRLINNYMSESYIDTRTPEQMYQQAYDRIISIGEAILKARGYFRLVPYRGSNVFYSFGWDKLRKYAYLHTSEDGFYHNFMCLEDKAFLVITKYSERPTLIQ